MSLIKKLTGIAYSGGVKVRRDKVINDGTQYLFDFANPFCSPLTGSLSVGTTIPNLVDGAPVATAAGAGTATFGAKGLTFNGSDAFRLDLGTSYSLVSADADFLVMFWLSFPTGRNVAADVGILGNARNSSDNEFLIRQNGANSLIAYADGHVALWSGGGSSLALPDGVAVPPTQYALAWIKTTGGANIETYKNGVLQGSTFNADSDLTLLGATNGVRIGGGGSQEYGGAAKWLGTVHRVVKENLTLSGATAASQVALDYARNSTRFI